MEIGDKSLMGRLGNRELKYCFRTSLEIVREACRLGNQTAEV